MFRVHPVLCCFVMYLSQPTLGSDCLAHRQGKKPRQAVQSHKEGSAHDRFLAARQSYTSVSHPEFLMGRYHLQRRFLHNIMTKNLKMVGKVIQGQSSVGCHLAGPRAYLSSAASIKVNVHR